MSVVTDSTAGYDVTYGRIESTQQLGPPARSSLLSRNFHRHEQHRGTNLLGSHRHLEVLLIRRA